MKFIPQKTFTEISEIPYNETLEEFMTEFNKKVKLRLVPVQKTIAEATRIGFSGVSNAIPLGGKLILPKKRGRPRKE